MFPSHAQSVWFYLLNQSSFANNQQWAWGSLVILGLYSFYLRNQANNEQQAWQWESLVIRGLYQGHLSYGDDQEYLNNCPMRGMPTFNVWSPRGQGSSGFQGCRGLFYFWTLWRWNFARFKKSINGEISTSSFYLYPQRWDFGSNVKLLGQLCSDIYEILHANSTIATKSPCQISASRVSGLWS